MMVAASITRKTQSISVIGWISPVEDGGGSRARRGTAAASRRVRPRPSTAARGRAPTRRQPPPPSHRTTRKIGEESCGWRLRPFKRPPQGRHARDLFIEGEQPVDDDGPRQPFAGEAPRPLLDDCPPLRIARRQQVSASACGFGSPRTRPARRSSSAGRSPTRLMTTARPAARNPLVFDGHRAREAIVSASGTARASHAAM